MAVGAGMLLNAPFPYRTFPLKPNDEVCWQDRQFCFYNKLWQTDYLPDMADEMHLICSSLSSAYIGSETTSRAACSEQGKLSRL